jgi:diguanylate cyclase (GGDEF)-like protein
VVVAEGPLDAARALAERLRSALAAQIMDPIGAAVTASFGVAERRSGESAVELLARADAALYAAKRSGRNRVHADP